MNFINKTKIDYDMITTWLSTNGIAMSMNASGATTLSQMTFKITTLGLKERYVLPSDAI